MGALNLLRNKSSVLGVTEDRAKRQYVAAKKNGDLMVYIKANDDDLYNIKNCTLHTSGAEFFGNYVEVVSDSFHEYNEDLHVFISNFVYVYHLKKIILNDYRSFRKNNLMFTYYIEPLEILQDGVVRKFKI